MKKQFSPKIEKTLQLDVNIVWLICKHDGVYKHLGKQIAAFMNIINNQSITLHKLQIHLNWSCKYAAFIDSKTNLLIIQINYTGKLPFIHSLPNQLFTLPSRYGKNTTSQGSNHSL